MPSNFKKLSSLSGAQLAGRRVVLRLDLNVPMENSSVRDDFRLRKIYPTLDFLKKNLAKTIIIAHSEGNKDSGIGSLAPVVNVLKGYSDIKIFESPEELKANFGSVRDGEVVALQNLRFFEGEKNCDPKFAKKLAELGEIFINEAFSVSHRKHASIVALPKFLPSFAGLLFEAEVENLSKVFDAPKPFLFILGGAKFETKFPIFKKFMEKADWVFLGGALANDAFKAKGLEVGRSVVSPVALDFENFLTSPKFKMPNDVVLNKPDSLAVSPEMVGAKDAILDAGPKTLEDLKVLINEAKFVLWNGPLGDYEKGFSKTTEELAKIIAQSPAESIIGGGDTLATIAKLGLEDKFSFVSTGGGSMLEFLANETLPGIEALKK